ncbi:MAG: hypothetical protein H6657_26310 [Ardenticatenaceae bacterium]|nr:hypothetical protein [Ardenticatenaceae bacterium]
MLRALGAGAWSGVVGGALLGFIFTLLIIFYVPTTSQDEADLFQENFAEQQIEFQGQESPSTLTYILGLSFMTIRYGGVGALIGAAAGALFGSITGIIVLLTNQIGNVHFIGAALGAVIMGLLSSQMNLLTMIIGILFGLFGGFISGKQFKSFFR